MQGEQLDHSTHSEEATLLQTESYKAELSHETLSEEAPGLSRTGDS